jgi:hypothetical protein
MQTEIMYDTAVALERKGTSAVWIPSRNGEKEMLNRFSFNGNTAIAPLEDRGAFGDTVTADFGSISGEEIERLITLCQVSRVLWRTHTKPARASEPFGIIA